MSFVKFHVLEDRPKITVPTVSISCHGFKDGLIYQARFYAMETKPFVDVYYEWQTKRIGFRNRSIV